MRILSLVHFECTKVPFSFLVRDWSLITRRGGGLQNGNVKFYPYEKGGGAKKVLAMLKGGGGHKQFWGSFYLVA